jgi:folate-dependent phosphoribosylglycinamide formyltransferase PurN
LRIAFITGTLDFSGMIIAAILREDGVEAVGAIHDFGGGKAKARRGNGKDLGRWQKVYMRCRLSMVDPLMTGKAMLKKLGLPGTDVYTSLNKADAARYPTLPELAARENIPFHRLSDINAPEAERLLTEMKPDVIVGLSTRIIKPNILSIPRLGVLNGHSSLLPDYRGSATEFWQLAHGETTTGVTVHWMHERVDEGAILAQDEWPIGPKDNHYRLRLTSQFKRVDTWRRAIRAVIAGEKGRPQGSSRTPKFRQPTLTDRYDFYIRRQKRSLEDA